MVRVLTSYQLDFSAYIAERTRDFTGREWVFAEINRRLAAALAIQDESTRAHALASLAFALGGNPLSQ